MINKKALKGNEKRLVRRYLVWCYKTTKESLDRVDRYYTQNKVDIFMLSELRRGKKAGDEKYLSLVNDFEQYLSNKLKNADKQKFKEEEKKKFHGDYLYLKNRFAAVERTISYFLGKKELTSIERDYEEEMTNRIWQAREHA